MADLQTSLPNSSFSHGFGDDVVTGLRIYVDSGRTNASDGNDGETPREPMATWDAAFDRVSANNGDFIYLMPGHVETVTAEGGLTLDIAGVTTVFLGEGASRAQVTFTTVVGADMNVEAEGNTLINPRFVAGIDALTGPIDVNSANFSIINGLYEDAPSLATTDCIVADANADDLLIDGWEYRVSTTGTQKVSNIKIAGATRPVLRRIRITGNFNTGNIQNDTAWADATLDDVIIDNANTGPVVGILLQSTSTGKMRDVNIRVDSGTTYLTANNNMQFYNCFGVGVDADGGEQIGAIIATSVDGKVDSLVTSTVRTLVKTDGAVLSGDDPLFTITGGSIRVISMIGTVTTTFDGAANMHLNVNVTDPAADVDMSTNVSVSSEVKGTVWTFVGPTGVLTPTDAGVAIIDMGSTTVTETQWIIPIGTIEATGDAARAGVIQWILTYYANSAATVVVAA